MLKRILVIDDDMEFLQLLSSILQKQFQVYEATGVAEAMKCWKQSQSTQSVLI